MKMEIRIEGKAIAIEAEGAVSVRVTDGGGAAVEAQGAAQGAGARERDGAQAPAPGSGPAWEAPVLYADGPEGALDERGGVAEDEAPEAISNGDLFQELSGLRRRIAAEQGVPPYVVFKDATLREMAEKRPADLAALGAVGGVGAAKLEKYGGRFLAAIRDAAA